MGLAGYDPWTGSFHPHQNHFFPFLRTPFLTNPPPLACGTPGGSFPKFFNSPLGPKLSAPWDNFLVFWFFPPPFAGLKFFYLSLESPPTPFGFLLFYYGHQAPNELLFPNIANPSLPPFPFGFFVFFSPGPFSPPNLQSNPPFFPLSFFIVWLRFLFWHLMSFGFPSVYLVYQPFQSCVPLGYPPQTTSSPKALPFFSGGRILRTKKM